MESQSQEIVSRLRTMAFRIAREHPDKLDALEMLLTAYQLGLGASIPDDGVSERDFEPTDTSFPEEEFGKRGEVVTLDQIELRAITRAIDITGDVQAAAKLLGIGKTSLYRKLRANGIVPKSGFVRLEEPIAEVVNG